MLSLRLYHYWQSSCSWRVRWALAHKNVPVEFVHMELLSPELKQESYLQKNPMGVIPTLEIIGEKSRYLGESMAILEWIEDQYPNPRLKPADPFLKARCQQLAEIINAGTQPLQNIRIARSHSTAGAEQLKWNQKWISYGLSAYERLVQETAGSFSIGDDVTWADLALVPQVYNATVRYELDVNQWPTISRIAKQAYQLKECVDTAPEKYLLKGAHDRTKVDSQPLVG